MTLKIMICPTCGSEKIKKVRRNLMGISDCGEKVYDREAMRKIEAASPAFRTGTRKVAVG
jgi:hypothetical protein